MRSGRAILAALTRGALFGCVAAVAAYALPAQIYIQNFDSLPPGVKLPGMTAGVAPAKPSAAAPAKVESPFLDALKPLDWKRTSEAVIAARAELAVPSELPERTEGEKDEDYEKRLLAHRAGELRTAVVAGAFERAAELLRARHDEWLAKNAAAEAERVAAAETAREAAAKERDAQRAAALEERLAAVRAELLAAFAREREADGLASGPEFAAKAAELETRLAAAASAATAAFDAEGAAQAAAGESAAAEPTAAPPSEARALFDHIVGQLAQSDQVLVPDELVAVSATSAQTEPLASEQIEILAGLLTNAATRGTCEPLAARLRAGTAHFGLDTPVRRGAAAELFSLAGLPALAEPFLDPLDGPAGRTPELCLRHALAERARALEEESVPARRAGHARAFALAREALEHEDASERAFLERGLNHAFAMLGEVEEATAHEWKRSLFAGERRLLGALAFARFADLVRADYIQRTMPPMRAARLKDAQATAQACLEACAGDDAALAPWRTQLAVLAQAVRRETERAVPQERERLRNPGRRYWNQNPGAPLSGADLAPVLPNAAWLAALEPGLRETLARDLVALAAMNGDKERALALVADAQASRPALATELAHAFVADWAADLNPNKPLDRFGASSVIYSFGYVRYFGGDDSGAMPMTRARQVRSLERLAEALGELRALGVPDLDPVRVVPTFAASHSKAEVFRREDVERLFGPIDELGARTATALAREMWTNLSGNWRSEKIARESGTRRTPREVREAVERGYDLAARLVRRARSAAPDDWESALIAANVAFDRAEFAHDLDPSLENYAPLRDEAFAQYAATCALYADALARGEVERSAVPHLQWFVSALGASELGYLTATTKPDHDQVEQVARTLAALPGEEAQAHRGLFAVAARQAMNGAPAATKPRFARHAMRVVGEHEDAKELADLARFYEEITAEVKLSARVHGSSDVPADDWFGLWIALRYTSALERESGGFTKYLQNQVWSPQTGNQVDYRDRFEQGVRDALGEHFEVGGVLFCEPSVRPRGFGLEGWLERPVAYCVLRARDPSVDRLPELQLDVEFSDGKGPVLLPIVSDVVLVDAKRPLAEPRPHEEPTVELLLDARELDEGRVKLEVRGTAKGLVPPIPSLLADRAAVPGFTLVATTDNGPNLVEMDAEKNPPLPLVERTFELVYEPVAGSEDAKRFHFPAPLDGSATVTLQRYADLDIEEAAAVEPLDPSLLPRPARWPWLLAAVLLLAGGTFAFTRLRRARTAHDPSDDLQLPERITPVSAIAFLRRVQARNGSLRDPAHQHELARELDSLERRYFAPSSNGDPSTPAAPDLEPLLRRWLERAR